MFSYFYRVCYQNKYVVGVIIGCFILFLFGDTAIHFIAHLLHVLLEFVESLLEHILEAAFGLTPRQAQVVLFYSFVIVMSYISWQLTRKAYFALLDLYEQAKLYWQVLKKSRRFKAMLMLGAIGTTVYLFS